MSKFLKFIVNLVVLLVIVIALALMVPQFLGVETVMNDNTDTETNLPTGSVAYGRNVNVGELKEGDRIIYSEGAQTYVYEITEMDTSAGSYQVRDVYSAQSGDTTVKLTKNVAKVVLVVPFIGYAAIALQTTEGLIVVGLGVVFLVILFILSELWRKDKYDDEEEEEEEQGSEDSGEEEEEILTRKERRRLKKEEKRRRKLERKGYDDEEEEETLAPLNFDQPEEMSGERQEEEMAFSAEAEGEQPEETVCADETTEISQSEQAEDATVILPDLEEIMSLAQEEDAEEAEEVITAAEPEQVSDATGVLPEAEEFFAAEEREEEAQENSGEFQDMTQVLPEIADPEEISEEVETEINNIEETISAQKDITVNPDMVPVPPTVDELIQKAQAAGDAPEIKKDEENNVTILDYSDIL